MTLVLDASMALAFVLADEFSPEAEQALDQVARDGGLVPAMWDYEVLNGLRSAVALGRLTPAAAAHAARGLSALHLTREAPTLGEHLLRLARESRLSVYDAAYLDLAHRHRVPLATRDEAVAQAARQFGITVTG